MISPLELKKLIGLDLSLRPAPLRRVKRNGYKNLRTNQVVKREAAAGRYSCPSLDGVSALMGTLEILICP
jgi:hypothetical protein